MFRLFQIAAVYMFKHPTHHYFRSFSTGKAFRLIPFSSSNAIEWLWLNHYKITAAHYINPHHRFCGNYLNVMLNTIKCLKWGRSVRTDCTTGMLLWKIALSLDTRSRKKQKSSCEIFMPRIKMNFQLQEHKQPEYDHNTNNKTKNVLAFA